MFSNSKPNAPKPSKKGATSRDTAVTILTSGCHFNGKLYCRGSSRIAGKIEGTLISEGLLIIEEEAIINAQVTAEEAVIQGQVQGRLEAKTRVELCASSHFEGDIKTPLLIVQEGAQFNGRSTMTGTRAGSEHGRKYQNEDEPAVGEDKNRHRHEIAAMSGFEPEPAV